MSKMNKELWVCCQHLGELEKLVRALWASNCLDKRMARLDPTQHVSAPGFSCQSWPRLKHRMANEQLGSP